MDEVKKEIEDITKYNEGKIKADRYSGYSIEDLNVKLHQIRNFLLKVEKDIAEIERKV